MKKRILLTFLLFISLFLSFFSTANAVCPVCTVAVAGGLGLSRYLGVDDTISGIWIGGLILSFSLWSYDWLIKKYPKLLAASCKLLVIVCIYALVILPLYFTLPGIGKLIGGITIGSLVFLLGVWLDKKVRKIKGKQLFNYQKIIFPIVALVIISLALSILIS